METFRNHPPPAGIGRSLRPRLPDRMGSREIGAERGFAHISARCGGDLRLVQATETLLHSSPEGIARIVEGLITGIGFIGGGAILKEGHTVYGTATAASLWATGAIGVAVGLESYDVAIALALITVLTLRLLSPKKELAEMQDKKES